MAKYATLEKVSYAGIISKPVPRILGKPLWHQKEKVLEEASKVALEVDLLYPWSGT